MKETPLLARKNGQVFKPITGVPTVFNSGQGGLLDVALDSEFESNHLIYLSFAEPAKDGNKASTALGRGSLINGELRNFEVIFRQGSALIGGLSSQAIIRLEFEGTAVKNEERIPLGVRVRDIDQAPDGSVYLLTDASNGKVLRLYPKN